MWESHQDLRPLVEREWQGSACHSMYDLERKLHGLSSSLSTWGRSTFRNVRLEIKTLRNALAEMRAVVDRVGPSYKELIIVERLMELQHREEVMWHQRSRIQWLARGDRNMRFFHLRASRRKKKNRIVSLLRHDGSLTDDQLELSQMATDFYNNLYSTEGTSGMEEVLQSVPRSVTPEINEQLVAPFEEIEVKKALFQMYPLKSRGPDGILAQFFQKHWEVCGPEVTRAVLHIL